MKQAATNINKTEQNYRGGLPRSNTILISADLPLDQYVSPLHEGEG
jgi:hypothetical protein